MNAGRRRVDPIPLLPIGLQREYGVIAAAAESQLQFALDLQRRWRSRAGQCVFSCADAGRRPRGRAQPAVAAASAAVRQDAGRAAAALARAHARPAPALEQLHG